MNARHVPKIVMLGDTSSSDIMTRVGSYLGGTTESKFMTVTLEHMKHGCNPFALSQILREWLLPCFAKGNYV